MSLERSEHTEDPAPKQKLVLVPGFLGVFGARVIITEESQKPASDLKNQGQNLNNPSLLGRITHAIMPEGISVFGQNFDTAKTDESKDNPQ
jgi:hypothetical protein